MLRNTTSASLALICFCSSAIAQSLVDLRIEGAAQVIEQTTTLYTVVAEFVYGWEFDVTLSSYLYLEPGVHGEIGVFGDLESYDVDGNQFEKIVAVFVFGEQIETAELPVTILDMPPAGLALNFDGSNDFLLVPHSPAFEPADELTLEVWVKADSAGATFSKIIRTMGMNSLGYYLAWQENYDNRVRFRLQNSTGQLVLWDPSSTQSYLGEWHHLSTVYSATEQFARLYVDGVIVAEALDTTLGPLEYSSQSLHIGNFEPYQNEDFDGLLDEVRIWNVARTTEQIRVNMHRRLNGNEFGLVGYWRFDELDGQVAYDSSIYGNDGILGSNESPDGDGNDPLREESNVPMIGGGLLSLAVEGPLGVESQAFADYRALATYEDGPTISVTLDCSWSIEPFEAGQFAAPGYFIAGEVGLEDLPAVVTADFLHGDQTISASLDVAILTLIGPRNALDFDGIDDIAYIPASSELAYPAAGGWTIEAWLYPRDLSTTTPIPVVGQISQGLVGRDPYQLAIVNGQIQFAIENSFGTTQSLEYPLAENQWSHVAGVYDTDRGVIALWVDGIEVAWTPIGLQMESNASYPILLGGAGGGSPEFNGLIDEVRIWSMARDYCDLRGYQHRRVSREEPTLVGYWRLDNGTGQILTDTSGGGHDGVLGSSAASEPNDPTWVDSDAELYQIAFPPIAWEEPQYVPEVSSTKDWSATVTASGLEMYISSERDGFAQIDLYKAERLSVGEPFGTPVLVPELSVPGYENHDAGVEISADGLRIYFSRQVGHGPGDIYVSQRAAPGSAWEAPVPVNELNTVWDEEGICFSADECAVVFATNRSGAFQYWSASRESMEEPWGNIEAIASLTGFEANPGGCALSADGRILYFSAEGPTGFGGKDIWKTTRTSLFAPFSEPIHVPELSTANQDFDISIPANSYTAYLVRQYTDIRGDVFVAKLAVQGGPVPGEIDCDGDVDLDDFAEFADCLTGPEGGVPGGCEPTDYDEDGDVDLLDYFAFMDLFVEYQP